MSAAAVLSALTTGRALPSTKPTVITSTVLVRDVEHFARLRSSYERRTRIVWRGPAKDPVFCFQNCRDPNIERLDITCETECEAVVVSERTRTGAGVIPSTMHQWRDVRVFCNGLAPVGFHYRATIDENNEHGRFDAVSVYGFTSAGMRFDGQQSKEHTLTLCRFDTDDAATAIASASGFTWIGGTASGCDEAVNLTRVGDPVTLIGVGVEKCRRLLVTGPGVSSAAQTINLVGVRFEADQLYADDEMIVLRHAGPLVIDGGRFGGGSQRIPRIALRGSGEQTLEMRGVVFGSYGAYRVAPVIAQNPAEARVTASGCRYQNDSWNTQNTATSVATLVERIVA